MDIPTMLVGKNAVKAAQNHRCGLKTVTQQWGDLEAAPGEIFSKINKKGTQKFFFNHEKMEKPELLYETNVSQKPWKKLSFLHYSVKSMLEKHNLGE